MPTTANNSTKEFTVKESKSTNLIIAIFFLVLFCLILFNFLTHEKTHNDYANNKLYYLLIGFFVAGVTFIIKSFKHATIITINQNGIYALGELKTNWRNFITAESTEEQVTGSYQDHFILLIQYYKDNEDGIFGTKIPMLDTYDKSGEEVIEAIKGFMQTANVEA
jgi:hypothetical protein